VNRQTRLKTTSPDPGRWADRGPLSLEDAAICEAQLYASDEVTVEVRDEAFPSEVFTIRVTRQTAFRIDFVEQPPTQP
jgi:hypothetical protein